eukprot:254971-Prorocentrum_lima.AAC.1
MRALAQGQAQVQGHKVVSPTYLLVAGILFEVKCYHPKDCQVMEGHQDREHRWMSVNQLEGCQF